MKKLLFLFPLFLLACANKDPVHLTYNSVLASDAVYRSVLRTLADYERRGLVAEEEIGKILDLAEYYVNSRTLVVSAVRLYNARNNPQAYAEIREDVERRLSPALWEELETALLIWEASRKKAQFEDYIVLLLTRLDEIVLNLKKSLADLGQPALGRLQ